MSLNGLVILSLHFSIQNVLIRIAASINLSENIPIEQVKMDIISWALTLDVLDVQPK
jgi:hypothetical protein